MKRSIKLLTTLLLLTGSCKKNNQAPQPYSVTDIDGNQYDTVHIGTQIWLNANLRTAHYRDGSVIAETEADSLWAYIYNTGAQTSAWCYYDGDTTGAQNNSFTNALYGKLYNWYAVTDPRQLCPVGWHVPSDSEWTVLSNFMGGDAISGGRLKTTGLWTLNINARDSFGFTAYPSGCRNIEGVFDSLNDYAAFGLRQAVAIITPGTVY